MADVGVRPARLEDVGRIAEIQVKAWDAAYRAFIPADVLAEMTGSADLWRERWAEAVTAPPTPRHQLLVSVVGDTDVTGFAAISPASDPDQDSTAGELVTLLVDPDRGREGHGSRLLSAVADIFRDHGFSTVITWVFVRDEVLRGFLQPAGWATDGARRTLDFSTADREAKVEMARLHTDLRPVTFV
ncbi:MAG: GNAT family N-acetyltransferase [Streptosporangiaceae bacterium]